MARKKLSKQYVRKVGKIGNEKNFSYYLTLPKEYVRNLDWREGQKIVIKKVGTKLHVIDWKPRG
jgi:bifunctional DNA-binding transcriptional regulator/antitoxin component of YhaV-PrlF toxin-antitoxin module